jgi:hypothetical protein
MSNVIVVKKKKRTLIRRDSSGAVIRVTHEAADALERLLNEAGADLTVIALASSLIEYAAKDTIIRVESEEERNE